jgi:protein-L-isoaspartate(D-aspartate) O-methyltransferase
MPRSSSETYRLDYARQIVQLAEVRDPRIERAFASVVRESFLPPPPWTAMSSGLAMQTRELSDIYNNVLVAIDPERGINNGEPALHAAWIDTVAPQPGETVVHVGAGTGYYTAILALLVGEEGRVEAYEYEQDLAAIAARNLQDYSQVSVHAESAFGRPLPKADLIYVNAGVVAPDSEWLRALRPGGRLIFPWQPREGWGPAVLVTRHAHGFSAKPLRKVGFIPCSGANEKASPRRSLTEADLGAIRSIWIASDRPPDARAVAVYDQVWFSSEKVTA